MNHQKEFLLELGQLTEQSVNALAPSFDGLPPSPYLDGAFRLRRYSHFNFTGDSLTQLPTKAFVQGDDINTFQGNVERVYPEIEDQVINSEAFVEMFRKFKEMAGIEDETPIEVHQMRIIASNQAKTEAAPEGVHQDGFERLAVFVIDRRNVNGGEIRVHTDKESSPFVSHAFDKGEFVVLNDRRFWHSANAIEPANDSDAHMDVFVLTA
ncbi:2OG-Fe dioxygenase family protein [Marinobacterium arenosum]|uniref:2OG-Fe dioxygenase family protein n=1 Tax=Marinobacterium arenosum TaxID=2862496 RepID=UPI001C959E91|nr:2OG-Fe dioxygenase family protein [Marinobacterium arenosum]MBY4676972.1 2OG-Fe dioxygenase family protein [Marinobacterium arenosum]